MNLDRIIERIENKLDAQSSYLKGSPWLYQAFLEVVNESGPETSEDAKYARAAQRAKELVHDNEESLELHETATDRIFGDALVRALAPTIENLRKREFESPEPPFGSVEKVSEWIKARSSEDLKAWRAKNEQRSKADVEIQRLADEHLIELTFNSTLLPYQVPDDEHVKWVRAVPGTYLYDLAKETDRIAKRTGLPQDALVVHVLTGLKPVRSRVRVTERESHYTLPSGEQIHVNEAVVTFRARDLTDKELRSIYRMVKGHVGGKGTTEMGDKDEVLWTLVQDMGGPPHAHGRKGPFWRAVQEKMNEQHPEDPYTTWEGVKSRYYSILARLQPPRDT